MLNRRPETVEAMKRFTRKTGLTSLKARCFPRSSLRQYVQFLVKDIGPFIDEYYKSEQNRLLNGIWISFMNPSSREMNAANVMVDWADLGMACTIE